MIAKKSTWVDPDDAPPVSREILDRAELSIGGEVVREATGTLTKDYSELQLRQTQLTAMLALRRGKPGFAANAIAIEAELKAVEEELAKGSDGASRIIRP